ncbi:adenylate/guanylate cyclase domain-containing protein [Motiliproteus sp. MSK22-1]|uniref:adenylate/guanylate cyclase domain-containing protein n=1 Tax=Motiliproteus sp. MSK22-1 TaxID=1897630 RepID=UPI0009782D8B|nr:adenylate/guanylate cyclase domain-containing protein [Motiliproteus sp. MSK22-1]OMH33739.1 hypothetical protein BGP75_12125 [Motiliproteus sp. MSK22-1]
MSIPSQTETKASLVRWDPRKITEWLMKAGRGITSADQLTAELGRLLVEAGAPVYRIRIGLRTIHPLVVGSAYTWWRDKVDVEAYNPPHGIMESADYIDSPIECVHQTGQPFRRYLEDASADELHSTLATLKASGATDYLAIPLKFVFDDLPTPLIFVTDRLGGFSPQDIESFNQIALFLAPVLEVHSQHMTSHALLETYLGPRTGQKVLSGQIKRGDAELIEAAIWYSDMRDSTAITEVLSHDQLLKLLNRYFEVITKAVTNHGGEVLRFIGDAMLVVFPTDKQRNLIQARKAALAAAKDAHIEIQRINPLLEKEGLPSIRYGLGLDVGEVVYGNVGAPDRLDFTVLGSAVNRAARIENLTKEAGCSLLVSEQFASQLGDTFTWLGDYKVAGVEVPLSVYCAYCDSP